MADQEPDFPQKPMPPPPEPPPANAGEERHFRGLLEADENARPEPAVRIFGRRRKKQRSEMGFFEHLEELRITIIKCIGAALVGMMIVGAFYKEFFKVLQIPLYRGLDYDTASHVLASPIDPMGKVMILVTITVYGGILIVLPLIMYFLIQFVAPGLTLREKRMLRPGLYAALILFFIGALACFYIMLPFALRFSHQLDIDTGTETHWTEDHYYSLVVMATAATGLVFEFPLILVIMQVLGIIHPDTLRAGRRYAILIIAVVGGFLAPSPDVLSMLGMMAPMVLLYEGSIIVGAYLRKRKLAAEARRELQEAG